MVEIKKEKSLWKLYETNQTKINKID